MCWPFTKSGWYLSSQSDAEKQYRSFFFLQQLNTFVTASTNRFMILQKEFLKSDESTKTSKSLSATRWSARDDVCQAVDCGWNETQEALLTIEDDTTEKLLGSQ